MINNKKINDTASPKMNMQLLESVLGDLNSHFVEYKKSNGRSLSDRYDIRTYTKAVLYYINREIKDSNLNTCLICKRGFNNINRGLRLKSILKTNNGLLIHYNCSLQSEVLI